MAGAEQQNEREPKLVLGVVGGDSAGRRSEENG